ncbi:hypothetical protein [Streptomyces bobili]
MPSEDLTAAIRYGFSPTPLYRPADLYSLGCVLIEAVTGRRPFTGMSWQLINQRFKEPPALLRTLRPDAPVELERLVSRLLAKNSAQRPDSADEVCDLLEEINDRYFGDTSPSPAAGPTSRPRSGSTRTKPPVVWSSPCV